MKALARRNHLNATTLSRHLTGKAIMQDGAALEWINAGDGLPISGDPDPMLYYWHGTVYRWPNLPATIAGQQANLLYPLFLADLLATALWNFDESCLCRVVNRSDEVRALLRSPPVSPHEQWMPGRWRGRSPAPPQVLSVFHPEFWRDTAEEQFRARIESSPTELVGDYLNWYAERRGIGALTAARARRTANG